MNRDVLQSGLLQGRLPGRKEFYGYYLELTASQFHIFDGQESNMRKHLLSVHIDSSDTAGVETKVRKGEFRFYLDRPGDGKYVFKVPTDTDRDEWIRNLQRVINKTGFEKIEGFQTPSSNAFSPDNVGPQVGTPTRVDIPRTPPTSGRGDCRTLPSKGRNSKTVLNTALPPPPGGTGNSRDAVQNSPRASIISTDSGIGTSVGGEIRRPSLHKLESKSMPNSGSGTVSRTGGAKMGHSADAEFRHGVKVTDEDMPAWFWGTMSRQDCEDQLREKGEIGNFVVRVNATGHHIMSFWRVDGVHHHKILTHEGIWRFEKAAVNAEGESLADLLDTYMKNCTKDKNIKPYGGGLFDNYTYAWTPKELDMDLLGKKLKQQKELRERAKKPRKKVEYTPVEVDTGLDDDEGGFENDPLPGEEPVMKMKKNKPLPLPPTNKSKTSPSPPAKIRSSPSPPTKMSPSKSPTPPTKPKTSKPHAPIPPVKPTAGGQHQMSDSDRGSSKTLSGSGGPTSTGMALLQEMSEMRRAKHKKKTAQTHPPPSNEPPSPPPDADIVAQDVESDPVYGNTSQLSQDQAKSYENCSFDGPPPPPSGAATSAAPSEYQNFQFLTQKQHPPQTKRKPTKTAPEASAKLSTQGKSVKGHGPARSPNPSARKANPHVNGSVGNNSAGEYQNFEFNRQRH